jgi:hypothetical protein
MEFHSKDPNGALVKSGNDNTGAEQRAAFNVWNAVSWPWVQMNKGPFFNKSVKGLLITPKCLTNFL